MAGIEKETGIQKMGVSAGNFVECTQMGIKGSGKYQRKDWMPQRKSRYATNAQVSNSEHSLLLSFSLTQMHAYRRSSHHAKLRNRAMNYKKRQTMQKQKSATRLAPIVSSTSFWSKVNIFGFMSRKKKGPTEEDIELLTLPRQHNFGTERPFFVSESTLSSLSSRYPNSRARRRRNYTYGRHMSGQLSRQLWSQNSRTAPFFVPIFTNSTTLFVDPLK